jgi:hypothetical protein
MAIWRVFGLASAGVELVSRVMLLGILILTVAMIWSAHSNWRELQERQRTRLPHEALWHTCGRCHWRFRCRAPARVEGPGPAKIMPIARAQQKPAGFKKRWVSAGGVPIEVAETAREPNCCQATVAGQDVYFCSFACYRVLANANSAGHSLNPSPDKQPHGAFSRLLSTLFSS